VTWEGEERNETEDERGGGREIDRIDREIEREREEAL